MGMNVKRLGDTFFAEVEGIDVARDLDAGNWAELHDAYLSHQVLILHDQSMTAAQFYELGERFGPVEPHTVSMYHHEEFAGITVLSNRTEMGRPKGIRDAGSNWHSDYSYKQVPANATMLYALEVPEDGGDTIFADLAAAYDALPEKKKQQLDGLQVRQQYRWSRDQSHPEGRWLLLNDTERGKTPEVIHPLVRPHPETGRKGLFISAAVILVTLILGSLAIAFVIPQAEIQLSSGLIESFRVFFSAFGLPFMVPIIALLIVLGGFGTVAAWVLGPSRAIMIAAQDDAAPKWLMTANRHNAPFSVLLGQAVVVSFLSLFFIFMPSINAAFVLLSTMTAQLALVVYMMMFAAAIKLRYSQPDIERKYKIPGGNFGMWLIAGLGFSVCVLIFFIGFIPPTQIAIGNTTNYEVILILGCAVMCFPVFFKKQKIDS